MRILHIIPSLEVGGAEVMLARLCPALSAQGFENKVISMKGEGPILPRLQNCAVPVECLNLNSGGGLVPAWRRLRTMIHRYDPEVIHAWMYHAGLAARSVAWGNRRPSLVLGVHAVPLDLELEKPRTRAVIRILARLSSGFDAICYVSKASAEVHASMGYAGRITQIIPNGFDVGGFKPDPEARKRIRTELKISSNAIVIGLVARWHPMKDHTNFLRAASIFLKTHPDANFVLVGPGIDANNGTLMKSAEELGVLASLRLCGCRTDMAAINASLDIATSSSAYGESLPLSMGEAMACAVPCVATAVGGVSEIVGDTGIVVPPGDPLALCSGWLTLAGMRRGELGSLGARARQRIDERFSLAACTSAHATLYRGLRGQL